MIAALDLIERVNYEADGLPHVDKDLWYNSAIALLALADRHKTEPLGVGVINAAHQLAAGLGVDFDDLVEVIGCW